MPTPDWTDELRTAERAARAAARIQVERYGRVGRIEMKGEKDVVTEVDHRSEEAILDILSAAYPDDAFLAEESGVSGTDADRRWVIDPLDGTANYANAIPFFSVSIALVLAGTPVVGVVMDPLRDEVWTAATGHGAFQDGVPIRIADKPDMVDEVVHLGLPRTGFEGPNIEIRRATRITRAMGSATLALAYVANGRFDAYVHWRGLSNWDIAAGGVIAEEAGAVVTSSDGGPWFDLARPTRSIGIVSASPAHHPAYLAMLERGPMTPEAATSGSAATR